MRQIRETEAEWQHERELAFNGFRDEARKRVLMANALDARLDAQEAAVDAEERRVASEERYELARQVDDVRAHNLLEKRETASKVREQTTKAVIAAQEDAAIAKKMAAAAKRADSHQWAQEKERNRMAQVARANVGKQAADNTKSNLRKSTELMTTERKQIVLRDKKERMIDYTVAQVRARARTEGEGAAVWRAHLHGPASRGACADAHRRRATACPLVRAQDKAKQLQSNREMVEKRYRSKFANAAESAQWETVPLRRWYG